MVDRLLVFLKGMAMGAADVVPGVSGGTIAFITGIYEELIDSLSSFNVEALRKLSKFDISGLWTHVNGTFLLLLFAGIATSILTLARILSHLLETQPIGLFAFFWGLVLASTLVVGRRIERWHALPVVLFLCGVGLMVALQVVRPDPLPATPLGVFIGGAIAICAMILPGISGSFILLLLGLYGTAIGAIKSFDIAFVLAFGAGCAIGLLSFVRLLSWLLKRWHDPLLALLTGILLGSLLVIWPWQWPERLVDEHSFTQPVLPAHYVAQGIEPQIGVAILAAVVGFALVLGLERTAKRAELAQNET